MILITGAAGFIGYHLFQTLKKTNRLILMDNLTSFSNKEIKEERWKEMNNENFQQIFIKADISDLYSLETVFEKHNIDSVINLAAITGVRQSKEQPEIYKSSNIKGFQNILRCCEKFSVPHLIYASSSSVYGSESSAPFTELETCIIQESYYAETKKQNEIDAEKFVKNNQMTSVVGLRFFTVYGPWGRTDMATYKFIDALMNKKKLTLFGKGTLKRDFTYIDDVIYAIAKILERQKSGVHFKNELFNVGYGKPLSVLEYVAILEEVTGEKAHLNLDEKATEEMLITWANTEKLEKEIGTLVHTSRIKGIQNTFNWYSSYSKKK